MKVIHKDKNNNIHIIYDNKMITINNSTLECSISNTDVVGWQEIDDNTFFFKTNKVFKNDELFFNSRALEILKIRNEYLLVIKSSDDNYAIVDQDGLEKYNFKNLYYLDSDNFVILESNHLKYISLNDFEILRTLEIQGKISFFDYAAYVFDGSKIFTENYINHWHSEKIIKFIRFYESLIVISLSKISIFAIHAKENNHLFDYLGKYVLADVIDDCLYLCTSMFIYVYDLSQSRLIETIFVPLLLLRFLENDKPVNVSQNVKLDVFPREEKDLIHSSKKSTTSIYPSVLKQNVDDLSNVFIFLNRNFITITRDNDFLFTYVIPNHTFNSIYQLDECFIFKIDKKRRYNIITIYKVYTDRISYINEFSVTDNIRNGKIFISGNNVVIRKFSPKKNLVIGKIKNLF